MLAYLSLITRKHIHAYAACIGTHLQTRVLCGDRVDEQLHVDGMLRLIFLRQRVDDIRRHALAVERALEIGQSRLGTNEYEATDIR